MQYSFHFIVFLSIVALSNADSMNLSVNSPANGQVFLPLGDTPPVVSVSIDWGDGSSGNYTAPTLWSGGTAGITHSYALSGFYNIRIDRYGDGPIFLSRFGWKDGSGWSDWSSTPGGATFQGMTMFGELGITSLRGCFAKATIGTTPLLLPSTVTDLAFMCAWSTILPLNFFNPGVWNVSSVTDMSYMFFSVSNFNKPLNNWDVSSVINMNNMFTGTLIFNQPLDSWNVKNVENMDFMFYSAVSFQQLLATWCVPRIATRPTRFADGSKMVLSQEPIWGCIPPAIPQDVPVAPSQPHEAGPQAQPFSAPIAEQLVSPSNGSPVIIEAPVSTSMTEPPVPTAFGFPPTQPTEPPAVATTTAPGTSTKVLPAIAMLSHNSRSCNDVASIRSLVSAVWHRGACSAWGPEDYRIYYQASGEQSDIIHQKSCTQEGCIGDCIDSTFSTNDCSHSKDSFLAWRPSTVSTKELGGVFPNIDVNMHASFVISLSYQSPASCQARDLSTTIAQYWDRRGTKICVPSDSNPNQFFKYDCTSDGRIQVQIFSDSDCKPRNKVGSPQDFVVLDSCTQLHPLASSRWNYGGPASPWTLSCATGAKAVLSGSVSTGQPTNSSNTVARVSADSSGSILASPTVILMISLLVTFLAVLFFH